MSHRHWLSLLLGATLCFAFVPRVAAAHGPRLRGREIDSNVTVSAEAGFLPKTWRWFTVGLKPGPLTVNAVVQSCGRPTAPSCGIMVQLLSMAASVRLGEAACRSNQPSCRASTGLSYRVDHAGVYYVLISGAGGDEVRFTLRLHGNVYRLNCRKYC